MSSTLYVRQGNTTCNNIRNCDTVSAGAFFPQAQLEPPQKEMRQHRGEHVVVPPGVFAYSLNL
jgi:hypothetical protein